MVELVSPHEIKQGDLIKVKGEWVVVTRVTWSLWAGYVFYYDNGFVNAPTGMKVERWV